MPDEQILEVSPDSLSLKKHSKLPVLIIVTAAAMWVSLSDLQLKFVGVFFMEPKEPEEYFWLAALATGVAVSSVQTVLTLNEALKLYE